jgi:alkanesulfonate monooxygenase SsuD/methylene tetrahydromethanopterin reductase-like flavin-dependent oxidoreductase (luciferase family)
MRFGLAPVQSLPRSDAMVQQSMLAESLGFDMLWVQEHHAAVTMYPAPLGPIPRRTPLPGVHACQRSGSSTRFTTLCRTQ